MINKKELMAVVDTMAPLYFAVAVGYICKRYFKIFTDEQGDGINKFVSNLALPILSFHAIATTNLYKIDVPLLAADAITKLVTLLCISIITFIFFKSDCLGWVITLFSVASLPQSLVIGVPLLSTTFGSAFRDGIVQLVVIQSSFWYPILLLLFELRAVINSLNNKNIELSCKDLDLEGENGTSDCDSHVQLQVLALEESKLQAVINSLDIKNIEPSCNHLELEWKNGINDCDAHFQLQMLALEESNYGTGMITSTVMRDRIKIDGRMSNGTMRDINLDQYQDIDLRTLELEKSNGIQCYQNIGGIKKHEREVYVNKCAEQQFLEQDKMSTIKQFPQEREFFSLRIQGPICTPFEEKSQGINSVSDKPPIMGIWKHALNTVFWKVIKNPNTILPLVGFIWSLFAFKNNIALPHPVSQSIMIFANTGMGMSMFSLGMFIALENKVVACGNIMASFVLVLKFFIAPIIMAGFSSCLGKTGSGLHAAIIQASLPQGVVPFIFSKEYKLHTRIQSTSVFLGMISALPIIFLYYLVLGL